MRIKILVAPPVAPAYGLTVGSIHDATANERRYHAGAPVWFVAGVGIYAHEAEELQECGHPVSAIVSDDEGTHYCRECAVASRLPLLPL